MKGIRETSAGKIDNHTALITKKSFRSPHHTITDVANI
jgi:hypothetical protein